MYNNIGLFKHLLNTITTKGLNYATVCVLLSGSHEKGNGIFSHEIAGRCRDLGMMNDILFADKIGVDYYLVPTKKTVSYCFGLITREKKVTFRQWIDEELAELWRVHRHSIRLYCKK
jgi:hypothetical protein